MWLGVVPLSHLMWDLAGDIDLVGQGARDSQFCFLTSDLTLALDESKRGTDRDLATGLEMREDKPVVPEVSMIVYLLCLRLGRETFILIFILSSSSKLSLSSSMIITTSSNHFHFHLFCCCCCCCSYLCVARETPIPPYFQTTKIECINRMMFHVKKISK